MLDIYLVRHANDDKSKERGILGGSLTKKGIKQAKLLAKRLEKIDFNHIYSSDLIRCVETLKIISKGKNLERKAQIYSELREVNMEVKNNPDKHKPEIINLEKMTNLLKNLRGNVLVVTSGVAIRILIGLIMNIQLKQCNFMQENTGVTRIHLKTNDSGEGEIFIFRYVNDTRHLKDSLRDERLKDS